MVFEMSGWEVEEGRQKREGKSVGGNQNGERECVCMCVRDEGWAKVGGQTDGNSERGGR